MLHNREASAPFYGSVTGIAGNAANGSNSAIIGIRGKKESGWRTRPVQESDDLDWLRCDHLHGSRLAGSQRSPVKFRPGPFKGQVEPGGRDFKS